MFRASCNILLVSALTGEEDPKCNPYGTSRVEEDGTCVCIEGFSGKTCRERCEDGTYGIDPSDQSNCKRKIIFSSVAPEPAFCKPS